MNERQNIAIAVLWYQFSCYQTGPNARPPKNQKKKKKERKRKEKKCRTIIARRRGTDWPWCSTDHNALRSHIIKANLLIHNDFHRILSKKQTCVNYRGVSTIEGSHSEVRVVFAHEVKTKVEQTNNGSTFEVALVSPLFVYEDTNKHRRQDFKEVRPCFISKATPPIPSVCASTWGSWSGTRSAGPQHPPCLLSAWHLRWTLRQANRWF